MLLILSGAPHTLCFFVHWVGFRVLELVSVAAQQDGSARGRGRMSVWACVDVWVSETLTILNYVIVALRWM